MSFISFLYLIALVRISSIVLNRNGDPFLCPDLRGKSFIEYGVSCGFFHRYSRNTCVYSFRDSIFIYMNILYILYSIYSIYNILYIIMNNSIHNIL